jgi:hypothetical protein
MQLTSAALAMHVFVLHGESGENPCKKRRSKITIVQSVSFRMLQLHCFTHELRYSEPNIYSTFFVMYACFLASTIEMISIVFAMQVLAFHVKNPLEIRRPKSL